MYLLDTDILSNLMKRTPSSVLVARVARVPPEHQFTSSITLGELVYGAHRLRERTAVLLERIEDTLLPNLPVLPDDTIDVADGDRGDTVDCGPDTTVGEDTVEVDAERDPTGAIVRIDTATDCETVNEVLIN